METNFHKKESRIRIDRFSGHRQKFARISLCVCGLSDLTKLKTLETSNLVHRHSAKLKLKRAFCLLETDTECMPLA